MRSLSSFKIEPRDRCGGSTLGARTARSYAGIADSIQDDIANIRSLPLRMRWGVDRDSIREQFDGIQRVLSLEIDYRAVAANLRTKRTSLFAMSNIIVHRVHDVLFTTRVPTMEWIDGKHSRAYMASQPTQNE